VIWFGLENEAVMRIHHLRCGSACSLPARFIPEMASQTICHCLLIETDDGLVLVDAGFGAEDARRPKERLGGTMAFMLGLTPSEGQATVDQVRALGFAPADVRHIVLTHLDFDHSGGALDFPEATVHVWRTELDAAKSPAVWAERQRYPRHIIDGIRHWQVHDIPAGERWYGFDCVRALPGMQEEVLLVPLPGHMRGHCGVAVRSPDGWLLHAGDAYLGRAEVTAPTRSLGHRLWAPSLHLDWRSARANQQRLRTLIAAEHATIQVFSAHDPAELAAMQAGQRLAPGG
jgi:glyoxylase-like metal-dependent hydrolase (beta-lactamase superfamily II)